MLDEHIKKQILGFQKSEITEHLVYKKLSRLVKDPHNREILEKISNEEYGHYHFWKRYTLKSVRPRRLRIWKYVWVARIFGLTFGLKLMEKGETNAQLAYEKLTAVLPSAKDVARDEQEHEKQLLNMMNEELLEYVGSAVLGLNDALVELTGALAGLTFALQNAKLVATAGLITGIAASLSMAASEYLSTKSEESGKNPVKAAFYTGIAYVFTVLFLIFPYLFFGNLIFCLSISIFNAILVISVFTFYVSVAKDLPFKKRFFEMAGISLGVASLTFVIGLLIRAFLNIEV